MDPQEILECSMIASVSGGLDGGRLSKIRPYRAPHHSCSMPAMVGGGMSRRTSPGEISRAHNGVLFLDEMPEFPRGVLDAMRQPLESGSILISRSNCHVTYPAKFQLIAAMNPCRCGYLNDPTRSCNRAPKCAIDYIAKISGPILDRIDIHVEVPAVTPLELEQVDNNNESSAIVSARIKQARITQSKRYEGYNIRTNSELDGSLLIENAFPDDAGKELLTLAMAKLSFSMRAYNRTLRIARTIADLQGEPKVNKYHIAEALGYRPVVIKR
jgi:magnesium chelatase family protein